MAPDRIILLDATLEHVERAPGGGMNLEERLRLAHQLERLHSDVIEAGSPMRSAADFEAVRLIARALEQSTVAARCHAHRGDIDRAWEAIQEAKRPRLHLTAGTSAAFLDGRPAGDFLEELRSLVRYAASLCREIEFSCEDATRTEADFLAQVVTTVTGAGATVVSLHDSAGCALPDEYGRLFRTMRERIGEKTPVVLGAAACNDLGLASANVLAALRNGARQAECSVNGIGARSGVAPLEELAVMIRVRGESTGMHIGINYDEIYRTSRLLSSLAGMPVQRNKPVVGANAFAHHSSVIPDGSGPQNGLYQIVDPQSIGIKHGTLVLGKHSDRETVRKRYAELGHELEPAELERVYALFRQVAEQKREVFDEDLQTLLELSPDEPEEVYHLVNIQVHSGTTLLPTATVELRRGNERFVDSATGDGPVDAAYKAIERITGISGQLTEYLIKSVSLGRDGFGEVFVRADFEGVSFHGRGVSTDIITGSAKAYLEAVNRAAVAKRKRTQPVR